MLKEQLLKRFEEIKPRPGEAAALVDRMKNGTFSEADRQRVLEILDAEQEMLTIPQAEVRGFLHGPLLPGRTAERHQQVLAVGLSLGERLEAVENRLAMG
jgi:hypothetical protein